MPSIMDLQLTTELDAVNAMLAAIGESPVNTIEDSGVLDAVQARAVLQRTSRSVQARGWTWNTDLGVSLARSFPDNEIILPANTIRVRPTGNSRYLKIAIRGSRLYNRKDQTFSFPDPVQVELVSFLAFGDIPESARQYITVSAARKFQEGHVGSDVLSAFTRRDEMMAWSALIDAETQEADYNIFTSDPTVTPMIDRDWGYSA